MARVFVFKPDGIGDFVLATGAIRRLARERGEENLILCVRGELVALARSQFPKAAVLEFPVAAERKVVNLFARNLACTLPLWFRLRGMPLEAGVCLRSMRNYLETFLFFTLRARRLAACENLLLADGRKKTRAAVEAVAQRLARATLAPYPAEAAEAPREIEAHRRVVSAALGREVPLAEVMPELRTAGVEEGDYWVCAPITNVPAKVYPLPLWREVFLALQPEAGQREILLVGSESQRERLEEFETMLKETGIAGARAFIPADLVKFMELLAGARMVFTIDTAAAHFAAALDRPCVVAFSGLHAGMFGPWQRSARQSWLLPGPQPPGKKKKWHARLAPSRIAAEARNLLAGSPS